jgi:hypothetical protein
MRAACPRAAGDPCPRDSRYGPVGEGQGTGLCLTVCRAIVTANGGTIAATSEVGKGSTFREEIPPRRAGEGVNPGYSPGVSPFLVKAGCRALEQSPQIR